MILFGNASDRWIESIAPGRKGDEHDNDGYFQCDSFFFHLLFDQPNMAALWELVKGDDTWFPSFPVACVRVQNWVLLHVSCKDGVSFLFSFFFLFAGFFFLSLVWGTTGKRNERRTNWRPRRELPRLRIHYERRCLFLFQWDGSFFCVCVCV